MKRDLLLWQILLAGPLVWFVSLCAGFALAPWACEGHGQAVFLAVFAGGLLITAVFGMNGWRRWHQLGREFPGEMGGMVAARRALALGAVLLNALFFL
ncbi:MAG TPA: hypothetical protein VG672_12855, partial [Bryobacteraceae bacterium]|nr:hypothetical protein [Bryobacteraceae bacterium]